MTAVRLRPLLAWCRCRVRGWWRRRLRAVLGHRCAPAPAPPVAAAAAVVSEIDAGTPPCGGGGAVAAVPALGRLAVVRNRCAPRVRRWAPAGAAADLGTRLLARAELPPRVTPRDFGAPFLLVAVAGGARRYYGPDDDVSELLRE